MSRLPARRVVAAAVVIVAAVFAYGWWTRGPDPGGRTADGAPALVTPVLPDLSRLAPEVQQQVRDRHTALERTLASGNAPTPEIADAFGSYGMVLLATEYFAEAEAAFEEAQSIAPSDMRWSYYLGHVYRIRQDPARAIVMFERVLALVPDDVPSMIWLGELHLATGDPGAAEPHLQRALALRPDSAAAAARLGQAALRRRDYTQAIEYLERALELDADAPGVHYSLGMAYRGAGQLARAETYLRRTSDRTVLPDDPLMAAVAALLTNAGAFEARGMAALDARDWTSAAENLRQAVALSPQNAVMRLNLGTALSLAGDPAAARLQLQEAIRLDPTLARAHFALGVLLQDEGRWSQAIESLRAAVHHNPRFVDAHFALAEALRRTGRADASLPHYDQVLRLNAAASQARFGHAMALVRLGRWAEARQSLAEAVRLHPDQPGFPHALARVLAAAPDPGTRNGARALALVEPLAQQHASPAVSETMAMVHAELGRFDEAVEWQQRAIAGASASGQAALADRMQENLALYRRRQPCRAPWRDDDPVHVVAPVES